MASRRVVVVLGMHRSGTSVVTRALATMGVEPGDRMLWPMADNPLGFWEDLDCLSINKQVLTQLGCGEFSLRPFQDAEWTSKPMGELVRQARGTLQERFGNSALWGFKDTRTIRVLPFWLRLLGELDCAPDFLVVYRNPLSVAQSLIRRNRMSLERGLVSWLMHHAPYIHLLADHRLKVIDYDALMNDPVTEIQGISEAFGLPIDADGRSDLDHYLSFLRKDLRHHTAKAADLERIDVLGPQIRETHDRLMRLEKAADPAAVLAAERDACLALAAELGRMGGLLDRFDAHDERLRRIEERWDMKLLAERRMRRTMNRLSAWRHSLLRTTSAAHRS